VTVHHVVVANWREDVSPAAVEEYAEALTRLGRECPTVRSYRHGPDLGERPGNGDYGIVAEFDDAAGWSVYDTHPAHARVKELARAVISGYSVTQFTT